MAYFQHHPSEQDSYTHRFAPPREDDEQEEYEEEYDGYDDGFDELTGEDGEPEEEIDEEELRREKQRKYRIAAGIGDFGAVLIGVVLILALVAFLINMIRFVSSDFEQNFSLWQTRF